jgi:hypothetical protein
MYLECGCGTWVLHKIVNMKRECGLERECERYITRECERYITRECEHYITRECERECVLERKLGM